MYTPSVAAASAVAAAVSQSLTEEREESAQCSEGPGCSRLLFFKSHKGANPVGQWPSVGPAVRMLEYRVAAFNTR